MYKQLFLLLLVFYLQDIRAVEDLRIFFVIKPSNLKFLMDGCYELNSEFTYSVIDVDAGDKGNHKRTIVFFKHLKNPISCFVVPSREFGVFAEGSDDYEFPLSVSCIENDGPRFNQYVILKSLWYQLFYSSSFEQRESEAKFAESLFNKNADLEVVLFFKCFGNEDVRNNCESYLLEGLEEFGWNFKFVDSKQENCRYIRVIITLGNENNNNFQTFQLDANVRLDIEKSGIRRKGETDKSSMIFFPSTVCQKNPSQSLTVSDIQNQGDYCAFAMIGQNNACVWTFPRTCRQLETFVEESASTGATGTNIYEVCRKFAEASPETLSLFKGLYVALTGIFNRFKGDNSNGHDTLVNTAEYLKELGFEVHNMPADGYCGWHAILHWICNNRPELLSEMTDNPGDLTAQSVFEYFADRAQELIKEDDREFIQSMANEMNGSNPDRMWLDDNHLRFLVAPFINQNILIFDMASNTPTSGCPFHVSLIRADGVDVAFQNQNEVVAAIHENRHCMILLHANNHWLLIMPGGSLTATESTRGRTTSQAVTPQSSEIDWSSLLARLTFPGSTTSQDDTTQSSELDWSGVVVPHTLRENTTSQDATRQSSEADRISVVVPHTLGENTTSQDATTQPSEIDWIDWSGVVVPHTSE
ncbi:OTU domain-containing protein [Endozoicomonas sp. 4G]|uniref:OTU domain-containing protein n=1 Tax=Endozoicomonas sp. 4G TaxID=2872754 RepID=UPI00207887B2|nr:OTU domain-containing protein [Endozoicomonas sp. 4G]